MKNLTADDRGLANVYSDSIQVSFDTEKPPLRILLADDHDVVRFGLRVLLEKQPGWEVCGEAENGRDAVDQVLKLRPDIVVVDIKMPELDGLEVTREILAALPEAEILIFSGEETEHVARKCFEAGARGYVLKTDFGRQLIKAVQALREHKMFISPKISELICGGFRRLDADSINGEVSPDRLSPRELVTVQLLADGHSNKEVAAKLGLSVRTAETHRAAIIRKLGLKSFSDLMRYAMRHELITL